MKRSVKAILMMLVLLISMSSVALAEEGEKLGKGFAVNGTHADVEITGDGRVSAYPAAGGDRINYFEGAERLTVTYTGAADADDQFMVLLVSGDGLPTKADAICYIDQVAKEGEDVVFEVYPMLPAENTELTLFITSSREGFATIEIPVTYAADGEYVNAGYMPGDANEDGVVDVFDAQAIINHIIYKKRLSGGALKAANVNGDNFVDVNDVMEILNNIVAE